jgi:hypothetical protein
VLVSWTAPYNGGVAISSYTIWFLQSDGTTYSTELTNCNGNNNGIVSAASCLVPISVLRAAPFNLVWGASVSAKVSATNSAGQSLVSSAGNGAVILTTPGAPINLANQVSVTSGSQIGLTWAAGLDSGGSPVIDYTLSYDQGTGIFVVFISGITATTYTATGLTSGTTYKFYVQARNVFVTSSNSATVSILAA